MTNSKQTNVKVTNFEVTVFQNNKFRSIRSYEYSKYSKLLALGQHKRFPKRIFNWSHSLFSFDRCSSTVVVVVVAAVVVFVVVQPVSLMYSLLIEVICSRVNTTVGTQGLLPLA